MSWKKTGLISQYSNDIMSTFVMFHLF